MGSPCCRGGMLLSPRREAGGGGGRLGAAAPAADSAECRRAVRASPPLPRASVRVCGRIAPPALSLLPGPPPPAPGPLLFQFSHSHCSPLNPFAPNAILHLLPRESGRTHHLPGSPSACFPVMAPPCTRPERQLLARPRLTLPAGRWAPSLLCPSQAPRSWEPASPLPNLLLPSTALHLSSPAGLPSLEATRATKLLKSSATSPSFPPMACAKPSLLPQPPRLLSPGTPLCSRPSASLTSSPGLRLNLQCLCPQAWGGTLFSSQSAPSLHGEMAPKC